MNGYAKILLIMASFIGLVGCGALNKAQSNMDQMVYYTGVMAAGTTSMANSTARIANATERMEYKADGFVSDLRKGGTGAETSIQNYSQAMLDNERAMIRTLQGIKQELNELKQELRPAASKRESQAPAPR